MLHREEIQTMVIPEAEMFFGFFFNTKWPGKNTLNSGEKRPHCQRGEAVSMVASNPGGSVLGESRLSTPTPVLVGFRRKENASPGASITSLAASRWCQTRCLWKIPAGSHVVTQLPVHFPNTF